jgi:hypothetical protein
MLTSSVVLLHDNAHLHTAARIRGLLEHFSWDLYDHPSYSPDLAPSDYHLFTFLKNWLRSQRFNNDGELMECVKMWLCAQAYKNMLFETTRASVPVVPMLRSSLSMCIFFVYNNILFLIACFLTACQRLLSE